MRKQQYSRSTGRHRSANLNLTSCIDVVFLLLVFFLVTANFAEGEGVITANYGAGPPPEAINPPPPTNPIRIRLTTVGTSGCMLDIEHHPLAPRTFSQLSKMLRDMQYNSALGRSGPFPTDTPVIIVAEKRVRWQHAMNAFNAAVGAGYELVTFAPAPDETTK